MVRVCICGFCGKMGQRIFALSKNDKNIKVVLGLERKNHQDVGKTIEGIKISDNPREIEKCDCVVDFTTPEASMDHLKYILQFKKAAVIGTTGLEKSQLLELNKAAKKIPIVFSPNMSVGVNLLFNLVDAAAEVLGGYNVSITEAHHIHKKDSPSGTAKKIADIVNARGFNVKIEEIKAIREGEIVGDHRIVFESEVDRIELFHHAKTRDIFVKGAILAAKWIVNKRKGLYSMSDILFTHNKNK